MYAASAGEGKAAVRFLSDTLLALVLGPSPNLIAGLEPPSQEMVCCEVEGGIWVRIIVCDLICLVCGNFDVVRWEVKLRSAVNSI